MEQIRTLEASVLIPSLFDELINRLALNYKKLQFRVRWVPTVEIEATCKSLGIAPTAVKPNGQPHYTLPAIIDRTDPTRAVVLSDSIPIIEYLEKTYPPPPNCDLFPPGTQALQVLFIQFPVAQILGVALGVVAMGHLAAKIEGDRADLRQRMEARFGKPFEDIEKRGAERDKVWKELEQLFKLLGDAMDKNGKGQFVMGERVRFADLALCGCLIYIKCVSPDDAWVKISSWHGGRWARYFDAFRGWMQVENPQ
ncbi:hypothetical protein BDZ97DRAFT_1941460 [Flammula alnicola]|nr:hypothetical protein BDZ97DRAFT_1941460 [Flammula alnicola]